MFCEQNKNMPKKQGRNQPVPPLYGGFQDGYRTWPLP